MKHQHSAETPIWPYVSVVGCLFLLSILAAESWHAPSSRQQLADSARNQLPSAHQSNVASAAPTAADAGRKSAAAPPLQQPSLAGPAKMASVESKTAEEQLHHEAPRYQQASSRQDGAPTAVIDQPAAQPSSQITAARPEPESKPQSELLVEVQQPESTDSVESARVRMSISGDEDNATQPRQAVSAATPDTMPLPSALVEQFETPQQESAFAPPVAEQIQLDVSIAKTPTLPEPCPTDEHRSGEPVLLLPRTETVPQRFSISDTAETDIAAPVSAWPDPISLVDQFAALQQNALTRTWATEAMDALDRLSRFREFSSTSVSDVLLRLQLLAKQAPELAASAGSDSLRVDTLRAGYAIQRRLQIWEQVHRVSASPQGALVSVGFEDLEDVLDETDMALGATDVARGWRKYLKLEELRAANRQSDYSTQQSLAREVLRRMESEEWLNQKQRSYLQQQPFAELAESLRRWAREPIDYIRLLDELENYETRRDLTSAATVAAIYQRARWSDNRAVIELADSLNTHYRNANLRVAASSDLINRLLPAAAVTEEDIAEEILGAYVCGTSSTRTQLNVALQPDPGLWRIGLEARGEVTSHTAATKGPATFYNDGHSEFHASKVLIVDRYGVKVHHAEAAADSSTALRGLETEFDTLPLFGLLARAVARNQHNGRVSEVQREADARLEARARARLDDEVHQRLEEIEDDFRDRILDPFRRLKLHPTALDMRTTDSRLVIRYRLAGTYQLGAHTPRPQAPGDSLLSVQIHESMLNNTIEQLQLNGREAEIRELYRELTADFERSEGDVPEDLPEDVYVRFAQDAPIRVAFDDGRVSLTMRIAELRSDRHRWNNFAVRAYYAPDPSQLQANLVRDGVIELAGQRLRLGDQIALRGIFSKVFSKNRALNIINKRLARHPKMADLQVTQFVISDGWIGVALGPERASSAPQHVAREPVNPRR